ncbi:hypothetical protein ALC57_17384 [Trachymyrmex cornetzi]|uniref:GIY-YIG domain-containing protein n=1 Tax=Trachymyrmex cornetzi TaxID=471704 RepID=A0A151ITT5_9HYME|nr:hypothetical protein ALC57_17384 [Trachymyrmex cornetzi]
MQNPNVETVREIQVDPQPFLPLIPSPSFTSQKNGWFVNLLTVSIRPNIQSFLQLGDNFALSLNNRLNLTVDLIKCIESDIYKLPIDEWISISNHSLPVLNNLASCSLHCMEVGRSLSQLAKDTRFVVPFVHGITEKFNRLNNEHVRVLFYSVNKLGEFIRVHKDPLPRDKKSKVVYKISCKSCDASYVGQTCRQLKSRITEHKNHIRWNTSVRNVITEHRLQEGHDFD